MGCKKLALYPEKTAVIWSIYKSGEHQKNHVNCLDYGARFYDPQIARFHTKDPLAEMFTHQSPYVYADNNPIRYIDYMGMNAEEPNKDEEESPVHWLIRVYQEMGYDVESLDDIQNIDRKFDDESNDEPWVEFGISKEDYDKLSPEHKEMIKGANQFVRDSQNSPKAIKAQEEYKKRVADMEERWARQDRLQARLTTFIGGSIIFLIEAYMTIMGAPILGPTIDGALPSKFDDEEIIGID